MGPNKFDSWATAETADVVALVTAPSGRTGRDRQCILIATRVAVTAAPTAWGDVSGKPCRLEIPRVGPVGCGDRLRARTVVAGLRTGVGAAAATGVVTVARAATVGGCAATLAATR